MAASFKHLNLSWEEIVERISEKLKLNRESQKDNIFLKWLNSKKDVGFLFDSVMIKRTWEISKRLKRDYDHFLVISGYEGEGKSTLGIQLGSYIDPEFSQDKICYTATQFLNALVKVPKGSCILIDEGGQNLFSREAMTLTNRMLIKSFMVMRQRNLCVIICIPNFHLLDSYIRLHRVNTLIHLRRRGFYRAITGNFAIKKVTMDGAKYKEILSVKIPPGMFWDGYFRKEFPNTISREEYNENKAKNMMKMIEKLSDEHDFFEIKMIPATKAAKELGCGDSALKELIQNGKLDGKKIGARWYLTKAGYKNLFDISKGREELGYVSKDELKI